MEPEHHAVSHREARRMISAGNEAVLAGLRKVSPTRRAGELALFAGLFVAGGITSVWAGALAGEGGRWLGVGMRAFGTLTSALALNGFVLLLHEGMHGILTRGQRLNRWLSVALGIPLFMSFSAYQLLHNRHHRFLGEARDPDHYDNYAHRPRTVWLMQVTRLLFGSLLYLLLIPVLSLRWGKPVERRRIVVEYAILGVSYALVFSAVPLGILLKVWLVPILFTSLLINLRGLTQHGESDPSDPFTASRSVYPRNPLVSWLMMNENLHLEHHLFPEIPSHHLPAVTELIKATAPSRLASESYSGFLAAFFRRRFRPDTREPIGLVKDTR